MSNITRLHQVVQTDPKLNSTLGVTNLAKHTHTLASQRRFFSSPILELVRPFCCYLYVHVLLHGYMVLHSVDCRVTSSPCFAIKVWLFRRFDKLWTRPNTIPRNSVIWQSEVGWEFEIKKIWWWTGGRKVFLEFSLKISVRCLFEITMGR